MAKPFSPAQPARSRGSARCGDSSHRRPAHRWPRRQTRRDPPPDSTALFAGYLTVSSLTTPSVAIGDPEVSPALGVAHGHDTSLGESSHLARNAFTRLRSAPRVNAAMLLLGRLFVEPLGSKTSPAVADSLPTWFRDRVSAMATPRFVSLWAATPLQFRRARDSGYAVERQTLNSMCAVVTAVVLVRERKDLRFRHVGGTYGVVLSLEWNGRAVNRAGPSNTATGARFAHR